MGQRLLSKGTKHQQSFLETLRIFKPQPSENATTTQPVPGTLQVQRDSRVVLPPSPASGRVRMVKQTARAPPPLNVVAART